jgi:hypothetical protein
MPHFLRRPSRSASVTEVRELRIRARSYHSEQIRRRVTPGIRRSNLAKLSGYIIPTVMLRADDLAIVALCIGVFVTLGEFLAIESHPRRILGKMNTDKAG